MFCGRQQSSEDAPKGPQDKVREYTAVYILKSFQLTFTPTWGKRDPGPPSMAAAGAGNPQMLGSSSMYTTADNNCKTSMDSMLIIYRLIQTEAQRIMACNGK